jgi:predicted ABC-type ATPase
VKTLFNAIEEVVQAQIRTQKPLAIIVAGHNGSGKSTMWRSRLSDTFRLPLINADRMMLSILPEEGENGRLVPWAAELRDKNLGWMRVAQQGVQAFVGHAMGAKVPFAMETVFSYWEPQPDGRILSKIDQIKDMQKAGYFVLLFFVGLTNAELSVLRVSTRVSQGGHGIDEPTLRKRFPKTQVAISHAIAIADAAILTDNSRTNTEAFTVCRVQIGVAPIYDIRDGVKKPPALVSDWMNLVSSR